MQNQQYRDGWNTRILSPDIGLPPRTRKYTDYLEGFWACDREIKRVHAHCTLKGLNPKTFLPKLKADPVTEPA